MIESNTRLNYNLHDTVFWIQDMGVPNATNATSGMTMLVRGGVNVAMKKFGGHHGPDGYYYNDCPRTVLALSPDRKTAYMVVVDGLPSNRAGIKFPKLGTFLVQKLHVGWAYNQDGGGSRRPVDEAVRHGIEPELRLHPSGHLRHDAHVKGTA